MTTSKTRRPDVSPRKLPRQTRSTATVDAIVAATAQVLASHGYEGATTALIAKRAGTSVGSLYQYFPTKEALVIAVAERHLQDMMGVFATVIPANAAEAPLEGMIRALVKSAVDAHAVDPTLHRILSQEALRVGQLDFVLATEKMLVAFIAELFRQREDVRKVDAELAAYIVVRCVDSLTHSAVLDKPELLRREDFIAEVTHLVVAYVKKS